MIEVFPMLAHPSKTVAPTVADTLRALNNGEWYWDLKWDGVRCMAHVENGVTTLINRNMLDITFRYPEIAAALGAAYPTGYRVFDGEIECFVNGRPDWPATQRRDAQQSANTAAGMVPTMPASYVAFDFLYYSGDDLRKMPFRARHQMLKTEAETVFAEYPDTLKLSMGALDGELMYEFVQQNGLEGLIAKRLTSHYTPGRSIGWVKLKPTRTASVLVTGYDLGKGALAGKLGALHIAVLDNGNVRGVGKVGTGFSHADRELVKDMLDTGAPLVVEVEYQEVLKSGQLRFPSFKGVRMDINLLDCTAEQIA